MALHTDLDFRTIDRIRADNIALTPGVDPKLTEAVEAATPAKTKGVVEREGLTGGYDAAAKPDVTVAPEYAQAKAGSHVFMRGHRGEGVKQMQEKLIALGYLDPKADPKQAADGIFGSATEAAVRAFQKDQGLKVDGMAGRDTIGKLDSVEPPKADAAPKGDDTAPRPDADAGPKIDDAAPRPDTGTPPKADDAAPAGPVAPAAPQPLDVAPAAPAPLDEAPPKPDAPAELGPLPEAPALPELPPHPALPSCGADAAVGEGDYGGTWRDCT
ncbi:MAG: peptidoglycan-binding protein [Deltaproteobacteria bacterium]|jgi:peptidoglycan hydrolase-like protein with peptidoglycan-binding domain